MTVGIVMLSEAKHLVVSAGNEILRSRERHGVPLQERSCSTAFAYRRSRKLVVGLQVKPEPRRDFRHDFLELESGLDGDRFLPVDDLIEDENEEDDDNRHSALATNPSRLSLRVHSADTRDMVLPRPHDRSPKRKLCQLFQDCGERFVR